MLNKTSFETSWELKKSVDFSLFSFLPFLFEVWACCTVESNLFSLCRFLQDWFSRDWKVLKPEPGLEASVFHLIFSSYCDLCVTKFKKLSVFRKCKEGQFFCFCLTKTWSLRGNKSRKLYFRTRHSNKATKWKTLLRN